MWLILPSTSCPSVAESADLTLPSTWLFRRLALCAGLNGKPTAWRFWRRAWKKYPWLQRLCGRISVPSTARRGVELWIASLRDTRVNHSPWLVSSVARTIRDTYGLKSLESCGRFVLDSPFSKMSRVTFGLDLIPFSAIFEDWGMKLRRLSVQRRKSVQVIGGSGCSSWPTSQAHDAHAGSEKNANRPKTNGGQANLTDDVLVWTPPQNFQPFLQVPDSLTSGGESLKPPAGPVRQWPTPDQLSDSPTAGKKANRKWLKGHNTLRGAVNHVMQTSPRRTLNPLFVCWLMGFPIGWAHADLRGFGATEMQSYLYRQRTLLSSSLQRLVVKLSKWISC